MSTASPIVYPLSSVPEKYKYLIYANPVTPIIEGFRFIFLGTGVFNFSLIIISSLITSFFFFYWINLFNKAEKSFIDSI